MLLTLLQNSGTSPTAYTISCSKVTYALTGKDATLTFSAGSISYSITASKGTYTLSGKDAEFRVGRTISSEKGVYSLTGKDADFKVGRSIASEKGTFTLSGKVAEFKVGRTISSEKGVYTLSGKVADFKVGRTIGLTKGVFSLTGKDANLIYGGTSVSYNISANKTTYDLIGNYVSLKLNFTQAITYVSPNFVLGRIRVYNGTIWQDVITYQYKNNKWNGFTK
jgi:hypothetical protein